MARARVETSLGRAIGQVEAGLKKDALTSSEVLSLLTDIVTGLSMLWQNERDKSLLSNDRPDGSSLAENLPIRSDVGLTGDVDEWQQLQSLMTQLRLRMELPELEQIGPVSEFEKHLSRLKVYFCGSQKQKKK